MQIFVLVANDETICGVYSTRAKLVSELTTTFAATKIGRVEIWDVDNGFVEYLKVNKTTTVTFEN